MSTEAEDIPYVLQEYVDEARALEKTLVQITWYMRGGVNIDQAYRMTSLQRKYALQVIDDNIERTSKTGIALL